MPDRQTIFTLVHQHRIALLWLCLFLPLTSVHGAQPVVNGQRHALHSQILDSERHYQVALPAAYHSYPAARYPVLYIVDGDYQFHFVAGLLEQMAAIGEQIPPFILVGISDRGNSDYQRYMTPQPETDDAGEQQHGEADRFRAYIDQELIPRIEQQYRVNDYRILAGHSLGGLFAISAMLRQPDRFSAYIAISPSLWWADQALVAEARERFAQADPLAATLYMSVADERGMGVFALAETLDQQAPADLQWHFQRFRNENHGSVGLPSLRWALQQEFADYPLTRERFYQHSQPQQLVDYYQNLGQQLGFEPLLPVLALGNVLGYYQRLEDAEAPEQLLKLSRSALPYSATLIADLLAQQQLDQGEWQQALTHYRQRIEEDPASVPGHWGAAKAYAGLEQPDQSRSHFKQALEAALQQQIPQWQINQLRSEQRQLGADSAAKDND
ncbi:MAG: hypothetical protein Tsb002_01690 [Wenzhouxiangellaceae bacterium]